MTMLFRSDGSPVPAIAPRPTAAQSRQRGESLIAIRDAGQRLAPSEMARTFTDGLMMAGWSPDDIEAFGNLIGREAGERRREILRTQRGAV